ncbi:hypothetical protein LTR84_012675 [Exophiala bonariae]|uniref:Fungal N-terminal domain-containing protein n=1 Tax=Exophiala bonariae TaxID=1690606 RepID=A0AAV9NJ30_9EURO|nr:hypothetical protein LTR84_012675 [Exophiala bonariae]
MDGISVASGVAGLITLGLQVSGTIAIYVNSIKERDKNIRELHDELLLLGEVLSGLRDFLVSEKAKGRSFDTNSVLQTAIRDCRTRIERIGDKLKPSDGGKVARALDKLKWPFEQREVMSMTENLRRFAQTFQFAFTIEGCNLLSKTSEDASKGLQQMLETSNKISELSVQMGLSADESSKRAAQLEQIIALVPLLNSTAANVNELTHAARLSELREQERRTSDILDWLAPVAALHKHRDLQLKRTPGTSKWFLESPEFSNWIDSSSADHDFLCIGGPGVGKSVLCSGAVDHLRAKYNTEDVAIAFYYYDYSEQQSQGPSNFARSLLRQLCSSAHTVPSSVADFYQRTRNDVKDQTWFNDLLSVLRRVVSTYNRCFIVVDALDEADVQSQRTGFFQVLDAIRGTGDMLRLLATARPHAISSVDRFHDPIMFDVVANPSDLRQYLNQTINEHPDSEYTMDPELKEHILQTLCNNANGMFLLPALQIRTILDQITKADVKRTLRNLSTSLTAAFQSTIERISGLSTTRRELAFRTLMWISHARRPLDVRELQHAMAIRLEDPDLDRDNIPSLRTLLDCCCGLVEVDRESNIIRLVHHSLEEYLRDQKHGFFKDTNIVISNACLRYLSFSSVKTLPRQNRTDFLASMIDLAFLEYAANEWGYHAYDVTAAAIEDFAIPALTSIQTLFTIARARDVRNLDFRKWMTKALAWAESGGAGVSLCAEFGLTELLVMLISKHPEHGYLNSRNIHGSTPLHEAALKGHEATAKVLIDHGSDVLDTNYGNCTPLYLAASYGKYSMINFLLQYGRPQLDVPDSRGTTPLHKVVEQGNLDMVQVMLEAGALVAAHDQQGSTPLHLAAKRGHTMIAKQLVSAGAFVHVKDEENLCPLDYAATGGHVELVEFLADNGGSILHKGREMWTPLHRAARGGHSKSVELLLKRDVNVLADDFRGQIPLHLAVRSGSMDTVVTLLAHRPELKSAQLFARDRKNSTPREVAFYTAHYNIHKYLRAVEWRTLGIESRSANLIATAIEAGDIEQVRDLLRKDPSVINTPDEDGQPLLHIAVQENKKDIVALLLQYGASIEVKGYHGWRALHIAASLGNLELVELCLQHNASVMQRTNTSQTALHKAASTKSVAVMRRLLEAGADPNAQNERGMTALHVAAHKNDIEIARLLIHEYGVDVLARDQQGHTPAGWAERSAHLEVTSFLHKEMKKARAARKSTPDLLATPVPIAEPA